MLMAGFLATAFDVGSFELEKIFMMALKRVSFDFSEALEESLLSTS